VRLARLLESIAGHERLVASSVLIAVNVYGLAAFFSDLGPMEPAWLRLAGVVLLFAIGGGVVGILLPDNWYLAAAGCCSVAMFGLFGLSMRLKMGGPPPYWFVIALELIGPLAVTLVSGYLGSRLRRRGALGLPPLP